MSAELSRLSEAAQPTEFHRMLHTLDFGQQLLRVYTQNIDVLEEKVGLTYGIPDLHVVSRTPRSRTPSLGDTLPRCIPLHGTIKSLRCQRCAHTVPLPDHMETLVAGLPPTCPLCIRTEAERRSAGKRARTVGWMRPTIVLYNEDHTDGETISRLVQADLTGRRMGYRSPPIDLLLVAGTSLRVSGAKGIVRTFAHALHARASLSSGQDTIQTIYLNTEFCGSSKDWEGVFDVWIQGDAQVLATMVHAERDRMKNTPIHD